MAWYAVHCTSINNTNTLINGDNKGVAAQLFSKWAASDAATAANVSGGIVAAFAQSNVGDTSPNTVGAFCADTGDTTIMPHHGIIVGACPCPDWSSWHASSRRATHLLHDILLHMLRHHTWHWVILGSI